LNLTNEFQTSYASLQIYKEKNNSHNLI